MTLSVELIKNAFMSSVGKARSLSVLQLLGYSPIGTWQEIRKGPENTGILTG